MSRAITTSGTYSHNNLNANNQDVVLIKNIATELASQFGYIISYSQDSNKTGTPDLTISDGDLETTWVTISGDNNQIIVEIMLFSPGCHFDMKDFLNSFDTQLKKVFGNHIIRIK